MKTKRMAIIGFVLLVSLSIVSLLLISFQDTVLAATSEDNSKLSGRDIEKPQANVTVVYTNTSTFFIPDGSCPTFELSIINVPDNLYVYNVKVGVNVSHPNRGDLEIHLLSPDTLGVQLIKQSNSTVLISTALH